MSLEKLQLPDDATEEQVKTRFKELARAAHPDAGGTAEQFQELAAWRDQALDEVRMGQTIANHRSRLHALRAAAKGVPCPRCNGTGTGSSRVVGFRTVTTKCTMCLGRGKIQ